MTKISIFRENGKITKVVCDGHVNYKQKGEDIVCSALSSIVQTAVLGILNIVAININLKRDEKKGFLSFSIPKNLSKDKRHDVDVILNTMLCGINDLHENFSDFISLEVS